MIYSHPRKLIDDGEYKPKANSAQGKNDLMAKNSEDETPLFSRIREAFGDVKASDVARALQIEPPSVHKWKTGKGLPSIDTLITISNLTNSSIHWLLTEEGPKERPGWKNPKRLRTAEEKRLDALVEGYLKLSEKQRAYIMPVIESLEKLIHATSSQQRSATFKFNLDEFMRFLKEKFPLREFQEEDVIFILGRLSKTDPTPDTVAFDSETIDLIRKAKTIFHNRQGDSIKESRAKKG